MFTNDHLEFHCIDHPMNHSHFIYMSLHCFEGQIKDSRMSCKHLGIEPHFDESSKKLQLKAGTKSISVTEYVPLWYYFRGTNIT